MNKHICVCVCVEFICCPWGYKILVNIEMGKMVCLRGSFFFEVVNSQFRIRVRW